MLLTTNHDLEYHGNLLLESVFLFTRVNKARDILQALATSTKKNIFKEFV